MNGGDVVKIVNVIDASTESITVSGSLDIALRHTAAVRVDGSASTLVYLFILPFGHPHRAFVVCIQGICFQDVKLHEKYLLYALHDVCWYRRVSNVLSFR